jgi:hypothetical protein
MIYKKYAKQDYCIWHYDDFEGSYNTDCGQAWCLNEGTPKQNKIRYCHYCGRRRLGKKPKNK